MRLTQHIDLVASGAAGFDLTGPLDCHVYLVRGPRGTALVDAGAGPSAGLIARRMNTAAGPEGERHLLLTHGHADHAGGAAELAERVPDLAVRAGPPADEWIASGAEELLSVDRGKASGVYPVRSRDLNWPGWSPYGDHPRPPQQRAASGEHDLTSSPAVAGEFNSRELTFLLPRQQPTRMNGKGQSAAHRSYASSTDLTFRQPGGRSSRLGSRRPDAIEHIIILGSRMQNGVTSLLPTASSCPFFGKCITFSSLHDRVFTGKYDGFRR
ncbi:MBL fold metallo-hydrolase [Actinomadura sp. 9N215]|uniref:MBL fold metallo-hydrolase n=1 Tax=Actinomadura sp. 9N215 TaxID=3375150 RepID=UPI00379245B4